MASIPKGIQNVNSILPKICAIMALSRHTDASYIPPFHRTVTRKLTRTQNYYFLGGAVCVTGLYPFYLGKTSNCTQICWHHLQNPVSELTTCFKEPRWQESEAAWGEFHGINRQKHYCQNHGNVTTTFQECFVLPVNKVRQKEEKKKKKKNRCPKAIISVFERQKKHPNMKWNNWCYHSPNTAEERGYYSQTIPHHSPPPLCSAFHFFSSPTYTINLIGQVSPVNSNIFNSLAFFFLNPGTLEQNSLRSRHLQLCQWIWRYSSSIKEAVMNS